MRELLGVAGSGRDPPLREPDLLWMPVVTVFEIASEEMALRFMCRRRSLVWFSE